MKKNWLFTLALIGLLCISMLTILLPNAKAQETKSNFIFNGSSLILSGSNIESTHSESSTTATQSDNKSAFVTNLVNMIEAPLILINGVLANWVTPANCNTPATLTPSGIAFVNQIANVIENTVQIISNYLKTMVNP